MSFHMIDCENVILREIAMPEMKRKNVSQTYRLCMESPEVESIDWEKVNHAIVERWSMAALQWIKKQAHSGRCFDEGHLLSNKAIGD